MNEQKKINFDSVVKILIAIAATFTIIDLSIKHFAK